MTSCFETVSPGKPTFAYIKLRPGQRMTCCSSSAPDTVFVADPSRSSASRRRWKHGSKILEHFPKQPMGPNPHKSGILSSLPVCPAVPIPQEASPPDVDLTQPAAPDGRFKNPRNTHGTQGTPQSPMLQGFARPPRNTCGTRGEKQG